MDLLVDLDKLSGSSAGFFWGPPGDFSQMVAGQSHLKAQLSGTSKMASLLTYLASQGSST